VKKEQGGTYERNRGTGLPDVWGTKGGRDSRGVQQKNPE